MTISMPSSRWRRTDMARGDMRTLAVGLSPTLTASMPASLRRAGPRGGGGTRRPRRGAGPAATSGAAADGLALSLIVGFRLADGGRAGKSGRLIDLGESYPAG